MQSDDSRRLSEGEFLKILSTPQYSDVVKKVWNKSVTATEDNQPSMCVTVNLLIGFDEVKAIYMKDVLL